MNVNTILLEGIETLCKNDRDINLIIASRKDDVISLLSRYINEIELFNNAYGLVGTENTEELVIKHILDALAPIGVLSRLLRASVPPCESLPQYHVADAGSGAGLPGIPLAIAMPSCEFSLIERMGRRAGFLCNTKAVLSLSNINIEEIEIEKIAKKEKFKNYFDMITFRAFKPLDEKLLKSLLTICSPWGCIAAYKGKKEKIEAEMSQFSKFQFANHDLKWETIPYSVPFLDKEERHMLIINKK